MKIRVFEAFAGIGCQREGLEMLQEDFPNDVQFEFIGISEIVYHLARTLFIPGQPENKIAQPKQASLFDL